jgi:hypothetical protein
VWSGLCSLLRHGRAKPSEGRKFVDARDKPEHDEVFYSPRAALAGIAADPNGEGSDPARTIRQFAECNSNVKRTARHLDRTPTPSISASTASAT